MPAGELPVEAAAAVVVVVVVVDVADVVDVAPFEVAAEVRSLGLTKKVAVVEVARFPARSRATANAP